MLIDTHCHLHDTEFFPPEQQTTFLAAAKAAGVEEVICIGTDPEDSKVARDFAKNHDGVFWTYGIHPESASKYPPSVLEPIFSDFKQTIKSANSIPVAIGEIGLDYHYEGYDRDAQIRLFEQMLQLSLDLNLPVSLHIREAFPDALAILDNFPGIRGVVHSFTGNKRELKAILSRDFYVGVNGLATYTTPPLPPLERILLETDAPFLTPVPFRGTINKPEYIAVIARSLSEKLGVAEKEVMEQTTNNARKIFKI